MLLATVSTPELGLGEQMSLIEIHQLDRPASLHQRSSPTESRLSSRNAEPLAFARLRRSHHQRRRSTCARHGSPARK
ncbi:hypothetical protein VFPFJ_04598 [Purpureocillium lilacinum]|uniref:Uncharacterized protein n=1 Tax=Purpureocillium lilacinum TaxID=33203 RepID=A0A179HL88_PURLI|nr:hypothetical protein VFPFJ_04598 [Purpureocillium lilacinum]OAQ83658.1 hypothetical protein VFPBJ_02426 [Purpureocillium lilacinum]OAQ90438.1 hypothetical protein VFPFJ_04598 [Purpureocillium lilacinum]